MKPAVTAAPLLDPSSPNRINMHKRINLGWACTKSDRQVDDFRARRLDVRSDRLAHRCN
jgi:hypothetical protein